MIIGFIYQHLDMWANYQIISINRLKNHNLILRTIPHTPTDRQSNPQPSWHLQTTNKSLKINHNKPTKNKINNINLKINKLWIKNKDKQNKMKINNKENDFILIYCFIIILRREYFVILVNRGSFIHLYVYLFFGFNLYSLLTFILTYIYFIC